MAKILIKIGGRALVKAMYEEIIRPELQKAANKENSAFTPQMVVLCDAIISGLFL